MTLTIRIPALRSLAFAAVGVILGATLIAPVMAGDSGADAVIATTYTRSVSCAGLSFYPANNDSDYDNDGTLRYHSGPGAGDAGSTGVYRCDPGLPNKAVVTKVQFTVRDSTGGTIGGSLGYGVQDCQMLRSGLTVATATSFDIMASVPSTSNGNPNAAPGIVRSTDTTIQAATVKNAAFAYWLECRIIGFTSTTGIYGADVIYTITAANG